MPFYRMDIGEGRVTPDEGRSERRPLPQAHETAGAADWRDYVVRELMSVNTKRVGRSSPKSWCGTWGFAGRLSSRWRIGSASLTRATSKPPCIRYFVTLMTSSLHPELSR